MKWFIGLLVIGAILACSDSLIWKILGIALFMGLSCYWLGTKLDSSFFFMLCKACAVVLVVIIIGSIIAAILKD